ncbi:MAG: hypothetical protein RIB58_06955 [Phycisphaerales bacterium]
MKHRTAQLDRRTLAATASLAVMALAALLGGCSSAARTQGPPQAEAYATTVWQGTPAALNNTQVARDDQAR